MYEITQRMIDHGGSFAVAIARALRAADPANRAIIEKAFAELFARYAVAS